jgi:hypothetical protein
LSQNPNPNLDKRDTYQISSANALIGCESARCDKRSKQFRALSNISWHPGSRLETIELGSLTIPQACSRLIPQPICYYAEIV